MNREVICFDAVAPARERGLKCFLCCGEYGDLNVAPARERGLKWPYGYNTVGAITCRSREGAWIEIAISANAWHATESRSREGAWIEMLKSLYINGGKNGVAPARERGLKSRWA